jgi:hypothetical protein
MTDQIVPPEINPAPEPELTPEEIAALDPSKLPPPPENETPEEKEARLAALEESNRKLWGWNQRLRKKPASPAAAAPAAPAPAAPAPAAPAAPNVLTREEGILFAKGFSEAEVEHAKKVATLQGVKLTDAVTDPLFTTWKVTEDKKAKDAAAQLPPSRGARPSAKKTLKTKGLTDEEHKELFLEKIGQ